MTTLGNLPLTTEMDPEAVRTVGAAGQPAFLNGWSNGTYGTATFYKDHGRVWLDGSVRKNLGNIAFGGTDDTEVIFTLPAGYRPATNVYLIAGPTPNGQGNRSGTYLRIDTAGRIKVIGVDDSGDGGYPYPIIDPLLTGLSFRHA